MKRDIFHRLPQPMAMLVLSAVLDLASAHTLRPLPRQTESSPQPTTATLAHHIIDVVPYPPLPTAAPKVGAGLDLLRRQDLNTICGYIGGDPELPATCGAGSHCVLDTQHGAVGCCPDDEPACTTGVFTACVDGNSPPQTEVDPYVFTCRGGDVCYRNVFEGGFSQFGCGTASDLATSVLATATGITSAPDRPTLTFSFTETAAPLTAPTTLGTVTVPSSTETPSITELSSSSQAPTESPTSTEAFSQTSGTKSSSSTSSASTTSTSSSVSQTSSQTSSTTPFTTSSATSTPTCTAAPSCAAAPSHDHTGAIVGGTISGVAVLVAAVALGIYLWRRKKRAEDNQRLRPQSPGGPTAYVSPMSGAPYHAGGYAPAHQDQEGWETGISPAVGATGLGSGSGLYPGGPYPPAAHPAGRSAAGAAGIYGGIPPARPDRDDLYAREAGDQVPLTREIDDFSRGFHDALGRIGEEDEYDSSPNHSGTGVNEGNGVNRPGGTARGPGNVYDDVAEGPYGGVRPLWQQQRRQSRNLMWM